jgi:hypothetical protein
VTARKNSCDVELPRFREKDVEEEDDVDVLLRRSGFLEVVMATAKKTEPAASFFGGEEERRGKGLAAARGGEGKGLGFWRRILVERRGGSR